MIQTQYGSCGVDGIKDYDNTNWKKYANGIIIISVSILTTY